VTRLRNALENVSPPKTKNKTARLVVGLGDAEEKADMVARLRMVLDALGVKEDAWDRAVRYLLDFYEQHQKAAAA
jgi:hypothetical protein